MARFTLIDDTTDVTAVTMHVKGSGTEGRKRLHLAGVDEGDRKVLTIEPTPADVVKASAPILYESDGGIWTVDLFALKKGTADVQAKVKGAAVAKVAVTVLDPLVLPPPDTDQGLLVRLFLAETASPETRQTAKWTVADATRSMQWMRLVLRNRLDNNPRQFMADGAKSIKDIVTAKDGGKVQYEGFSGYPTLSAKVAGRIADVFKIANDDSDRRQEDYARFVQAALDVAASKTEVQDPCGAENFLSGWMTVGSSPGDDSVQFQALMDNQFFMMKRKK
jgi:hypothetical protein